MFISACRIQVNEWILPNFLHKFCLKLWFCLSTCHVGRLGEDIFLCAACSVVFLREVRVPGCIGQSGGGQQHVNTWAEHLLEIIRYQPADFLGLYKVVLVAPGKIRLIVSISSSWTFWKYYSMTTQYLCFLNLEILLKEPKVLHSSCGVSWWQRSESREKVKEMKSHAHGDRNFPQFSVVKAMFVIGGARCYHGKVYHYFKIKSYRLWLDRYIMFTTD